MPSTRLSGASGSQNFPLSSNGRSWTIPRMWTSVLRHEQKIEHGWTPLESLECLDRSAEGAARWWRPPQRWSARTCVEVLCATEVVRVAERYEAPRQPRARHRRWRRPFPGRVAHWVRPLHPLVLDDLRCRRSRAFGGQRFACLGARPSRASMIISSTCPSATSSAGASASQSFASTGRARGGRRTPSRAPHQLLLAFTLALRPSDVGR